MRMARINSARTPLLLLWMIMFTNAFVPLYASGGQESATQGESAGDDVDYVAIAALMLRDGNLSRAESALANVDVQDPDVDRARFYTLQGLLALRRGDAGQAIISLEDALESGQEDPSINAYLAQAYYLTDSFEQSIEAISRLPSLREFPSLYSVRAAAEWNLGQWERAFQTLSRAELLFPEIDSFGRQQIVYLLELGLSQEAARRSVAFLESAPPEPESYLTIGQALRQGGERETAIRVLEEARLRFPASREVRLLLAQTYLEQEMPRTAARLVEEAAAGEFSLYFEAAELYRRAGDLQKAFYLNTLVLDAEQKTRQRFRLLLASERFEEAVAMEPRLVRQAADEEDEIRYSLAYAYYRTGQLGRARGYLQGISDPEMFRRAVELRQIIESELEQL